MAGVYGSAVLDVHDAAAAFTAFGDGSSAEEIAAFFSYLGKAGPGLYALLQRNAAVGPLFRATYNLNMLAELAITNKRNCSKISVLAQDVLIVLDNAGRRGAHLRDVGVEALAACFEDICSLVDTFCQHGWLLRLACDEQLKEEFETLHQAVLELLRGEGVLSLPGARQLAAADYRDVCRPLRRMLRQMGRGSLTGGVASLRRDEASCAEVARLLEVEPDVLCDEVAQVPESDLDLDTLFHQLLLPGSSPARASRAAAAAAAGAAAAGDAAAAAALGRGGHTPAAGGSSLAGGSLNGTAATALYGDLFRWYDANKSGALEREELQAVLADLGMLEGKPAAEAAAFAASYLRAADAAAAERGEGLGFTSFVRFYETLVMNRARQALRFRLGLQVEDDLREAFLTWASFGSREPATEMSGANFQKLCRDCGLMGRHTGASDVDLIFATVKTKGTRRITFEQFVTALSKLSDRKAAAFEDTVARVLDAGGPVAHGTQADAVRLHDDKSAYTGVHAHGAGAGCGARADSSPAPDLSQLVDRSLPETSRSRRTSLSSPCGAGSARKPPLPQHGFGSSPHVHAASRASSTPGSLTPPGGLDGQLAAAWPAASRDASAGASRRSSAGGPLFASGSPSQASVGVDAGGGHRCASASGSRRASNSALGALGAWDTRRIGVQMKEGAVPQITDVFAAFASFGLRRASSKGTLPSPRGGSLPSPRGGSLPSPRGGSLPSPRGGSLPSPRGGSLPSPRGGSLPSPRGGTPTNAAPGALSARAPPLPEMDGTRFAKLCRDAGFVDGAFDATAADLVFCKVKPKGAKKICYSQFLAALDLIATAKGSQRQALVDALLTCGGPALNPNATLPEAVRFYDAAV